MNKCPYLLAEVKELFLIGALGRALPDMHTISFSFPDGVLDRAVVCIPTEAELRVVASKTDSPNDPMAVHNPKNPRLRPLHLVCSTVCFCI